MAEDKKMTLSDEEVVTIEEFEIEIEEQFDIYTDEAFAALGEPNAELNHALLNNRDISDQHPITSITGLRGELDYLNSLKVVYSDRTNHANYYLWHDGNIFRENRAGLFVSFYPETNELIICNGSYNVFGVTVAEAGFVGGQDYAQAVGGGRTGRDGSYGIVAHSGLVVVRCGITVAVGDYVVPNDRGEAKKSDGDYGYFVNEIIDIDGVRHAMISLGASSILNKKIADGVKDLSSRMTTAEYNITSVTNVANSAYAMAQDAQENANVSSEYLEEKIENVLDRMDVTEETVGNLSNSVSSALASAESAKTIANSAVSSAESISKAAVEKANEALNSAYTTKNEVEKAMEEMGVDIDNAVFGIADVQAQTDENSAKIEQFAFWRGDMSASMANLKQQADENGAYIQGFVSNINKYSYGKYSPAHRFTYEEARNILEEGTVYVPDANHSVDEYRMETYEATDGYDKVECGFLKGYYYTWRTPTNGTSPTWIPSASVSVTFSPAYIIGNDSTPYWVATENITHTDGTQYEKDCLYKWMTKTLTQTAEDGAEQEVEYKYWVKVASLQGNLSTVTTSLIKQTSNSIETAITNIDNAYAGTKTWVEDNKASIQGVVEWQSQVKDDVSSIATIKQTADDAGASVAQVAAQICGKYVTIDGAWDETDKNTVEVYYTTSDQKYWYYKDGEWKSTSYPTEAGLEVNAASIVAAINDGDASVCINADKIQMTGTTTFLTPDDVGENGTTVISGSRITTGELDASKVVVKNLQANTIVTTGDKTVEEALSATLVSTTIYYALSSSKQTQPEDDKWSTTAPEKERGKYMWQKTVYYRSDGSSVESVACLAGADGESPVVVEITSSTGTIYINNDIKTTLVAKAKQDNIDITDEFPDGAFLWEKYDMYGTRDSEWSYTGKTVEVNNLDIYKRAMFNCVLDVEQRLQKEDIE